MIAKMSFAAAQSAAANRVHIPFLVGMITFMLFSGCLFGQAYVSDPLSNYSHALTGPAGMFYKDDVVSLSLEVGPASGVLGYELTLTLSDKAEFPASLTPDLSASWIGDATEMNASTILEPSVDEILIEALRTDHAPQSGSGEIFSIELVVAADSASADELVDEIGGWILIENIDPDKNAHVASRGVDHLVKGEVLSPAGLREPVSASPLFTVGLTAAGRMKLTVLESLDRLELIRLNGQSLHTWTMELDAGTQITLDGLEAGLYLCRAFRKGAVAEVRKVLLW